MRIISSRLPLMLLLLSCCVVQLTAAERKPAKDSEQELSAEEQASKVLDGTDDGEVLNFPSTDERRDIFYSLIDVYEAELKLAELEAGDREDPALVDVTGGGTKPPVDTDSVREAEVWAKKAVGEVEALIRGENWERAMTTAERHMNRIQPLLQQFAKSTTLAEVDTMLRQYYVLAENKKLYEEARAQFQALGLRVEGIIWSASQPSLAIISNEPVACGVNDRVKGTVIKNIDQNRVDFMYSYRQRRFHFQLYLEPNN